MGRENSYSTGFESGKKKKLKKGKKVGKNKSDEDDALTTAQREFSLNLSLL